MKQEAILIDFDDTICNSSHTYFIPQLNCAKILTMEHSPNCPNPTKMIQWARDIQNELMTRPGPIPVHVFGQSWIILNEELATLRGILPSPVINGALMAEAAAWLQKKYELNAGVAETLNKLNLKKIITTLGTQEVQEFKCISSGASKLVDAIEVMDDKNVTNFKAILEKHNLNPKKTIMIGDNPLKDIQPGLDLKMRTFQVVGAFDKPFITGIHPLYTSLTNFNEILNYL
jgi:FMN phosphatase YigB (HAD superfamily)